MNNAGNDRQDIADLERAERAARMCETFQSGAVRDVQVNKLRYDLIPPSALARLARVYTIGAKKYGDRNYEKGIPYMRMVASLKRHLENWLQRNPPVEQTDDDIAQVAWNAFAIMFFQDAGMSFSLDDRPPGIKVPLRSLAAPTWHTLGGVPWETKEL